MVKFTSTVVAASLFAGSALAAPSFSRSDNVAVTAREIEAMFGREMVEYASRSPNHWKDVVHTVHAVNKLSSAASTGNDNSRREYGEFEARQDTGAGGDPAAASAPAEPAAEASVPHAHQHQHNPHAHNHQHNHMHSHSHPRREYFEFDARAPQDDGAPAAAPAAPVAPVHHVHPMHHASNPQAAHHWAKVMEGIRAHAHQHQHSGAGPHTHQHVHQAAAVAPAVATRSFDDYYDSLFARQDTGAGGDPTAAAPAVDTAQAPVPHVHSHEHNHAHNHAHSHMHGGMPHSHSHSHSGPTRRSVDFDELYARYADFDDLD